MNYLVVSLLFSFFLFASGSPTATEAEQCPQKTANADDFSNKLLKDVIQYFANQNIHTISINLTNFRDVINLEMGVPPNFPIVTVKGYITLEWCHISGLQNLKASINNVAIYSREGEDCKDSILTIQVNLIVPKLVAKARGNVFLPGWVNANGSMEGEVKDVTLTAVVSIPLELKNKTIIQVKVIKTAITAGGIQIKMDGDKGTSLADQFIIDTACVMIGSSSEYRDQTLKALSPPFKDALVDAANKYIEELQLDKSIQIIAEAETK